MPELVGYSPLRGAAEQLLHWWTWRYKSDRSQFFRPNQRGILYEQAREAIGRALAKGDLRAAVLHPDDGTLVDASDAAFWRSVAADDVVLFDRAIPSIRTSAGTLHDVISLVADVDLKGCFGLSVWNPEGPYIWP